ncbi:uncharacterized protein LOC117108658 [Anneissia japonica]|uniref:uncharacterized protein LOC117108658 n=1 Tax=Anneissia japonica TaxID=1529436 RepID=UPI00142558FB|nr:uncharacterized protein LOC117108658 [Anneissia japonica]
MPSMLRPKYNTQWKLIVELETVYLSWSTIDVCPLHHTCQGRCGTPTSRQWMCNCDSYCEIYGDCCYDYWTNCNDKEARIPSMTLWDRTVCKGGSYYLISKCSPGTFNEQVRLNCEQPNQDDLLLSIPVSDASNLGYLNVYCALCNGVPMSDVVAWKVTVNCIYPESVAIWIGEEPLQTTTMAPTTPINFKNIISEIDRAPSRYYVYEPTQNYSKRYCPYDRHPGIKYCPRDFPDIDVAYKCKIYIAPVYAKFGGKYANTHCARCHGRPISLQQNTCLKTESDAQYVNIVENNMIIPITILLDFSSGSALSVESSRLSFTSSGAYCDSGQVFNPFIGESGECITITCQKDELLTKNGCIKPGIPMHAPAQFQIDPGYSSKLLCLCKHDSRIQLRYNFTNNDVLTRIRSWIQFQNLSFEFHSSGKPPIMYTIYFNTSHCDVLESITQIIYQQINSENTHLLEYITILQACVNTKNNMTPHNDYKNCNDLELNVDMVNIEKMNESVKVSDENKTFTISESDYRVEMTFNIVSESAKPIKVSISNCLDRSPDPTCPLIALNINDFEVIENTIWMYKPNGRQFTIDEIAVFSNDSVYVCSFFSQNGTHTYVSTIFIYDKTLQILNVVGVSCSLLGLFLTFIIRCIKKDLRTISGKIVMNIAAALFLAQFGTLLAKTLVESKLGCVAVAALLHYLWLVAFMWMFIMSTILFKSFRSLKSAVEHRRGRQSITMPFFCCWGLPVLVVAVAMTFHIWEYAPIKFSYGDKTVCWIRDEFAAFLFLGIPMATILALNSIMFVVIVCGIYQT